MTTHTAQAMLLMAALGGLSQAQQVLVRPIGADEVEVCTPARMFIAPDSIRVQDLITFEGSSIIHFNNESRLMTERLSRALQQTAVEVNEDYSDVYFTVVRSFEYITEWPAHPAGAQDLFYVGRAITLQYHTVGGATSAPSSARTSIVNIAGAFADYASFTDGSLLHLGVAPETCESALDLAFLVDGSGSVGPENWPTAIRFLEQVTNFTNIGTGDKTRVAIATFASQTWTKPGVDFACQKGELLFELSGQPRCRCCEHAACIAPEQDQCSIVRTRDVQFNATTIEGGCGPCTVPIGLDNGTRVDLDFTQGDVRSKVLSSIQAMTLPDGGTWTSYGLDYVRTRIFNLEYGMRPVSDGFPRVLIVMTDGNANSGYEPAAAAQALREEGVTVIAVRIGDLDAEGQTELQSIASSSDLAYTVPDFEQLSSITTQIDKQACFSCISGPANTPMNLKVNDEQFQCLSPCGTSAADVSELLVSAIEGTAQVFISGTRFGGPRNNTANLTLPTGTELSLPWPGEGFVILYGTSPETTLQILLRTSDYERVQVPIDTCAVDTASVGSTLVDLMAEVEARTPAINASYQFVLSTSGVIPYSVSIDGMVTLTSALPSGNSTITVAVTATPIGSPVCSDQVNLTAADPIFEFNITVSVTALLVLLPDYPTLDVPLELDALDNAAVGSTLVDLLPKVQEQLSSTSSAYKFGVGDSEFSYYDVSNEGVVTLVSKLPNGNSTLDISVTATPVVSPSCTLLGNLSGTNPVRRRRDDNFTSFVDPVFVFPMTVTVTEVVPVNSGAQGEDNNSGAIVGAVVGVLLLCLLLLLLALFIFKRRQQEAQKRRDVGTVNPVYGVTQAPTVAVAPPRQGLAANETYQEMAMPEYKTGPGQHVDGVYSDAGVATAGRDTATVVNEMYQPMGAASVAMGSAATESGTEEEHYGEALPSGVTGYNSYMRPTPGAPPSADNIYSDIAATPGGAPVTDDLYSDIAATPAAGAAALAAATTVSAGDDVLYDNAEAPGEEYLEMGEPMAAAHDPALAAQSPYDIADPEHTPVAPNIYDSAAQVPTFTPPVAAPLYDTATTEAGTAAPLYDSATPEHTGYNIMNDVAAPVPGENPYAAARDLLGGARPDGAMPNASYDMAQPTYDMAQSSPPPVAPRAAAAAPPVPPPRRPQRAPQPPPPIGNNPASF